MNTLQRLYAEFGQSPGSTPSTAAMTRWAGDHDPRGDPGLTSNPTIFAKAVAAGYYDELIRSMHEDGTDGQAIYQAIAVRTSAMRPTSCARCTAPPTCRRPGLDRGRAVAGR